MIISCVIVYYGSSISVKCLTYVIAVISSIPSPVTMNECTCFVVFRRSEHTVINPSVSAFPSHTNTKDFLFTGVPSCIHRIPTFNCIDNIRFIVIFQFRCL